MKLEIEPKFQIGDIAAITAHKAGIILGIKHKK